MSRNEIVMVVGPFHDRRTHETVVMMVLQTGTIIPYFFKGRISKTSVHIRLSKQGPKQGPGL